jgi:hypothetical protein
MKENRLGRRKRKGGKMKNTLEKMKKRKKGNMYGNLQEL